MSWYKPVAIVVVNLDITVGQKQINDWDFDSIFDSTLW